MGSCRVERKCDCLSVDFHRVQSHLFIGNAGDRVSACDRATHGRLAWGGREGRAEMQSMVVEKVQAAGEAMTTLMLGGSPEKVIARYREHVAFNIKRLTAV